MSTDIWGRSGLELNRMAYAYAKNCKKCNFFP